jgi:hypothetical protein
VQGLGIPEGKRFIMSSRRDDDELLLHRYSWNRCKGLLLHTRSEQSTQSGCSSGSR